MDFLYFIIAIFILCLGDFCLYLIKKRNAKKVNYQCEMCSNWDCPVHECNKYRNR